MKNEDKAREIANEYCYWDDRDESGAIKVAIEIADWKDMQVKAAIAQRIRLAVGGCTAYWAGYVAALEGLAFDLTEHTEEMRKLKDEWQENLEIQRHVLIDKASRWLQKNLDFGTPAYREQFVKDFIEAMKED